MSTVGIFEYLEIKNKRENTTFVFKNGKGYYIEKGVEIPAKQFEANNPLPSRVYLSENLRYYKGLNPDKKRI